MRGEKLTTPPEVSGTTLNFKVTLNKPGDYTKIEFYIRNDSTISVCGAGSEQLKVGDQLKRASLSVEGSSRHQYLPTSNGIVCAVGSDDWNYYRRISVIQTLDPFDDDYSLDYSLEHAIAPNSTEGPFYLMCQYIDTDKLEPTDATVTVSYSLVFDQAYNDSYCEWFRDNHD